MSQNFEKKISFDVSTESSKQMEIFVSFSDNFGSYLSHILFPMF